MIFRALTLLAPLAIVSACAISGPAVDGRQPANVDATIDMTPYLRFAPSPVKIKTGDTVEFRNVSSFTHTVSTRAANSDEAKLTALPAGAQTFNSGDIPGGGVWRHTFSVPGTYRYFCEPHHGAGMVGTIVVSPS